MRWENPVVITVSGYTNQIDQSETETAENKAVKTASAAPSLLSAHCLQTASPDAMVNESSSRTTPGHLDVIERRLRRVVSSKAEHPV